MAWARAFRITLAAALPAGSLLVFGTGAKAAHAQTSHAPAAHPRASHAEAAHARAVPRGCVGDRAASRRESPTRGEPRAPARGAMARMEADFAHRRRHGSRRPRRITVPLWVHVISS